MTAILQNEQGYLWMGSYGGLFRFDGVRFVSFTASTRPSLSNTRVTSLFEDKGGVLWIGHETGSLTRFDGGRFQPVAVPRNESGGAVEGIAADSEGEIWFLRGGAVVRVKDARSLPVPGGTTPSRKAHLIGAPAGETWLVANGRLFALKNGGFVEQGFGNSNAAVTVEMVAPAHGGGLWVATGGTLRKWHQGQWVQELPGLPEAAALTMIHQARSGALLAGTMRDGFFLIQTNRTTIQFNRANGLSHDWVRSMCEDREGNIWIGTGGGLDSLRSRKVLMTGPPDGFQGCAAMSICAEPDGSGWVGSEGAGLYRLREGGWTRYGEESGLTNLFVWSVLRARNGSVYAGTWGGGFLRQEGERFVTDEELAKVTAPAVALYESKAGELWVGTTAGLHRFREGKLVWSATADELILPDVRCIAEDKEGTIWFGMSGGGVGQVRGTTVRQLRRSHGLTSDFVSAIHVEEDGTVWLGTSDSGLLRYRNGAFRSISTPQGLPSPVIAHIVSDNADNLWISSNQGIFRASKAALHRCADGFTPSLRFLQYGRAEGMTTLACSGGFQPGATRTADGMLWFPTLKGLAVIDPARVRPNLVPPLVVVEELLAEGKVLEAPTREERALVSRRRPALKIPPGRQRVEIRYTALSFAAPDQVRFRYRLEELETDWVEAGTRRVAEYSYLPPGVYTFRVVACNNDDVWSSTGASLEFEVLPQPWQTWWFRALGIAAAALLLGLVGYAASRHRVRRKLELLERQRALERERARIARDIHDDLGASLTRISMLSQSVRAEVEPQPQVAADADQIYRTARELTRAMDEIVWAVNPRHDTLDSLVSYLGRYAQTFLASPGMRCRLDVPISLPNWPLTSEIRHNVFLAFKEALHNVVKHAKATEVRITLELGAASFVLSVSDNGLGFAPDTQHQEGRIQTGNGLPNMRKRIEEIGGKIDWVSAPGEGTKVRMAVPVRFSK